MLNINFVPDDYIQNNESSRTNIMYLLLFVAVMAVLGGSFATIKVRQKAISVKEKQVDAKMKQEKENFKQVEELQTKRNAIWKAALTTAELLEPVPRSVLLASLTNNLPQGVSLLQLNLIQKKPRAVRTATKYKTAQNKISDTQKVSPEKLLETHIDIEGIAPTDLQVATYIKQLSCSKLLDNVALVESREHNIKDETLRQFKLTAMLRKGVHITDEDIKTIAFMKR